MKLRPPVNGTEVYLAAIHDRLGQILDRLPAPPQEPEDGPVELREPALPAKDSPRAAPKAAQAEEKLTEPTPRKRTTTRKTGGA
jgi:hypothetical protein